MENKPIKMNYARVSFNDGYSNREYSYKNHDMTAGAGDTLVVNSPSGFKCVTVRSVTHEGSQATKWIVCKVDTTGWNFLTRCDINKQERIDELIAKTGKMEEVKKTYYSRLFHSSLLRSKEYQENILELAKLRSMS